MVPLLVRAMDLMGQALFYPPNVGGWPRGEAWINTATILVRYNFSGLVLTGGMPGLARRPAVAPPLARGAVQVLDGATTAREVVERLAGLLVAGAMAPERKDLLVRALGAGSPTEPFARAGADAEARVRSALHLLMSSPEYQVA
jgi:hypothetical protein